MTATRDLQQLLHTLSPVRNPGVYVFATLPTGLAIDMAPVVASIREAEGLSVVLAERDALSLGLPTLFRAAWLTLSVHSDLEALGLTAAVSAALAEAGIACNVVAGNCHDHLFVPYEQADAAMKTLARLQQPSTE